MSTIHHNSITRRLNKKNKQKGTKKKKKSAVKTENLMEIDDLSGNKQKGKKKKKQRSVNKVNKMEIDDCSSNGGTVPMEIDYDVPLNDPMEIDLPETH